jgi:hypothetical protein
VYLLVALLMLVLAPMRITADVATSQPSERSLEAALRDLARDPVRIVWSSQLATPEMRAPEAPTRGSLGERLDDLLWVHDLAAVEDPENLWTVVRRGDAVARCSLRVQLRPANGSGELEGFEVAITGGPRSRTGRDGEVRFGGLQPGLKEVVVARPGGEEVARRSVRLLPGRGESLEVTVEPLPVISEEIVVSPSRTSLLRQDPRALGLDREEIERMPNLGDDLLRAVSRLPGTAANDFSAQVGVRGGEPREVVLRIDGFEIPKPYHLPDLQNLFSLVDASIIDRLDLYAGGFPVELGRAQSGVLDAYTLSPRERFTELGVSFLTARALAGGGFDDGGSWLLAARRGYLDLVLESVDSGGDLEPTYGDLFAKVEKPLGKRSVISFATLLFDDEERFVEEDEPFEEEDELNGEARGGSAWLKLDRLWGSSVQARTLLGVTRRESSRSGAIDDGRSRLSDQRELTEWSLSQDWSFEPTARQRLKWGWSWRDAEATYDLDSLRVIDDPVVTRGGPPVITPLQVVLTTSGDDQSLYLAHRWAPVERFAVEVGARWERWSWLDEAGLDDSAVSPRLQAFFRAGPHTEVRAAWGLYHQAQRVDELLVEDGENAFFPVEEAEHQVLSVEHSFRRAGRLRVEAYRKLYPEPMVRYENLFDPIELFPSLEADRVRVEAERARVQGVEASWALSPSRRTRLTLSYVWSEAEDFVPEGEGRGRWVPRRFDQPHAVTALVTFLPSPKWSLELVGSWHTGWPTTPVDVALIPGPDGDPVLAPVLGPRNSERFPDYYRFDLRVRRSHQKVRSRFDFYFELFNLLDRDNRCCVDDFDLVSTGGPVPELITTYDTWLPLVPSFGIVWRRH